VADSTEEEHSKEKKSTKSKKDMEIERLKSELDQMKKEYEEIKSLAQRIQADFDNYRKRIQKENELQKKYGCEPLIVRMLEVIDTLERAISHEKGEFRTGLEMIKAQVESILSEFGVRPIDAVGMKFNPNFHDAIATGEGEEGVVIEEFQRGYMLHEKVIRHSKVRVGKAKEERKEGKEDEEV